MCFKNMFTHPAPFRLPMVWPAGIIHTPGDEAGKNRVENALKKKTTKAEHRAASQRFLSHRTVIQASGSQKIWGTQGLLFPMSTWPHFPAESSTLLR